MFGAYETSLQAHFAGCIATAPNVFGTLDEPNLTVEGSPGLALQITWRGLAVTGQSGESGAVDQLFALHLYHDSARADEVGQATVVQAFDEAMARLLRWRPMRGVKPRLQQTPGPEFDGRVMRLSIYFSVPGVTGRTE